MLKQRSFVRCVSATLCVGLLSAAVVLGGKVKDPPPPPPPPPPPAVPAYSVVNLGQPSFADRNEAGQVLLTFADRLELWMDGARKVSVDVTTDWLAACESNPQFAASRLNNSGVIAGCIVGDTPDPQNSEWLTWFKRPFVMTPIQRDGALTYGFVDLGRLVPDPDGDDLGVTVEAEVYGISDGSAVGIVTRNDWVNGNEISATWAYRLTSALNDEGEPIWFLAGDAGENALVELLSEPRAWNESVHASTVDGAGCTYLYDLRDRTSFVALPDGGKTALGSASDKFRPSAVNALGRVVGGVDKSKRTSSTQWAPAYVQPRIVGDQRVWFVDQNQDGLNDLLVKLGTLAGFADNTHVSSVNDSGTMVGYGSSSSGRRALMWVGTVAIDLNTKIDPRLGIVLTGAQKINNDGAITCTGQVSGQNSTYLLVPAP